MKKSFTNFRVSSAIKDIVGRDLITDDFVAVFELVKNSFDARATRIDIVFEDDQIYITDNGKGMSQKEIEEKWLFLGYSAKNNGDEEIAIDALGEKSKDFRDRIKRQGRGFAGSKGVGRFSCDRLGKEVIIFSKAVNAKDKYFSAVEVNWEDFENRSEKEFESINVQIFKQNNIELPEQLTDKFEHGTILKISRLRAKWNRTKLLSLKGSLAKLVNPFGARDDLQIHIHCKAEFEEDERQRESARFQQILKDMNDGEFGDEFDPNLHVPTHYLDIVNGKVQNFVFQKISKYTTNIEVLLDSQTKVIKSRLYDRGELIIEFEEDSEFDQLYGSEISVQIHYLNTAARREFTRFMGQQSVNFGSVFLFNNSFRVYPIGEPGDDTFRLDARKNQGRNRYLGTREIVGQIDVQDDDQHRFRETSSRNSGLIKNDPYVQLQDFFIKKCITLLERYVVNVNWVDKLDRNRLDLSGLDTDRAKSRIIDVVSRLSKSDDVRLIKYSPKFLTILDEKSTDFSTAMKGLEQVADKLGDSELKSELAIAKERQAELIRAQQKAREEADQEREARKLAEARANEAEAKASAAEKRTNFFMALETNDFDSLVSYHHHVGTYSNEVSQHIRTARLKMSRNMFNSESLALFMERVDLANTKIQSIVNFATKAKFVLDGEETTADLSQFIPQYVEEICTIFAGSDIEISVDNNSEAFELTFKPIEFFIVIDNLVHNAKKAEANKIEFNLFNPEKNQLVIEVTDDGNGLDASIKDIPSIFEKGITTTPGSGLGLYHSKQLISEMGGSISAEIGEKRDIKFKLEFAQ